MFNNVRPSIVFTPSAIDSWSLFSGTLTRVGSYSTPYTDINPTSVHRGFFAVPNFGVTVSGNATMKTEIEFFDASRVSIERQELQSVSIGGEEADKAVIAASPMNIIEASTGKTIQYTRYHITCSTAYQWVPAGNTMLKLGSINRTVSND